MKTLKTLIINFLKIISYTYYDYKNGLYFSLSFLCNTKRKKQAKLLLLIHSLEKGLSFENKKMSWGKEKAYRLAILTNRYVEKFEKDSITTMSINILNKYIHDDFCTKETQVLIYIKELIENNTELLNDNICGIKEISKPKFNITIDDYKDFIFKRVSVRDFSTNEISNEEINYAKVVASKTPTACNRQSNFIYTISDKRTMSLVLNNQLGDQGWCLKADKMFIITSTLSYYNGTYERHQAYIDGGLFAMNFLLGLHIQKIATCFKMYINAPTINNEFKRICNISDDEIPIVLIFAGHYKEEFVSVPKSYRF